MDIIPLLAEFDWNKVLELGGSVAITGLIATVCTLFFTRRKEKDEKEKVTFDTLLVAIKDRLDAAEAKITTLQAQLDTSDKRILELTITITKQEGEIQLYKTKIDAYENEAKLRREIETLRISKVVAEKSISERVIADKLLENPQ